MGTRSVIGMEQSNGAVRTVFCWLDGYPTEVGLKLEEHYQEAEKVEALMELGCLSSLGWTADGYITYYALQRIAERNHRLFRKGIDDPLLGDTLDQKCVIAAGHRKGARAAIDYDSDSVTELLAKLEDSDVRYLYLYGEGGWMGVNLRADAWKPARIADLVEEYEAYLAARKARAAA